MHIYVQIYRKRTPRFYFSVRTQSFICNCWQNLQAIRKGGAIVSEPCILKDCQPFDIFQICYRKLKKKSITCPQPSSPRVKNHLLFLPDYYSLLVKVNSMLLCCILVCSGWVLSTMLPCGCGTQT